jgi:hypothetical protein
VLELAKGEPLTSVYIPLVGSCQRADVRPESSTPASLAVWPADMPHSNRPHLAYAHAAYAHEEFKRRIKTQRVAIATAAMLPCGCWLPANLRATGLGLADLLQKTTCLVR